MTAASEEARRSETASAAVRPCRHRRRCPRGMSLYNSPSSSLLFPFKSVARSLPRSAAALSRPPGCSSSTAQHPRHSHAVFSRRARMRRPRPALNGFARAIFRRRSFFHWGQFCQTPCRPNQCQKLGCFRLLGYLFDAGDGDDDHSGMHTRHYLPLRHAA